jgi:hypothetical protein
LSLPTTITVEARKKALETTSLCMGSNDQGHYWSIL